MKYISIHYHTYIKSKVNYNQPPIKQSLESKVIMSYNYDDITPLKLNEEQPQLCQILYNDEYKQVMGILLALLQKEEYSERALNLTQQGIEILASHYTIWNYRYNIIQKLNKNLLEELDWCELISLDNEKNYQIWNYRQLIIELILQDNELSLKFNPHREYPIINSMLQQDLKNHHVWTYRKWLVDKFELYNDVKEIEFINKCIEIDVRNNSAWSHRFFLFVNSINIPNHIENEINYAKSMIRKSPQNQSSWNYLIGIYKHQNQNNVNSNNNKSLIELNDFVNEFIDLDKSKITSSIALELSYKILIEKGQINDAIEIIDLLITKYDPIRENYWNYEKLKLIKL